MSSLVRLFGAIRGRTRSFKATLNNGKRFVTYDGKLHDLKPSLENAPNYFQPTVRNTNVAKDVMLYGLNHGRFFKYMTLFAAVQFVFWGQMSYYSLQNYSRLRRKKGERDTTHPGSSISELRIVGPAPEASVKGVIKSTVNTERWYVKRVMGHVSSDKVYYSLAIGAAYLVFGSLVTFGLMFYSLRAVHSLILLRGGREVCITTFAPFGFTRSFTVSLENLTTRLGRQGVAAFLPIKVRRRPLWYLIDMRGKFFNPALFDVTVGLQRSWRK